MPGTAHDPVHRTSYAFTPQGENLIVETWLEPGAKLPAHRHPRQEERWSVVEGSIRIELDGQARTLRPEDGEVVVGPGVEHAIANAGDATVHVSCLALPARGLQAFLEESAAAAREGLFMRGGIPRSLRGARWAATFLERHREDVVMSSPPRFVQAALVAALGSSRAPTPTS